VVQNSHHTNNGPKLMYEYIDPMYSFWECTTEEMEQRAARNDYAEWLLTTKWVRTDEDGNEVTGKRENYNNDQTARLYIKDLKEKIAGLS
jgi:hypothetical protein